MVDDAVLSYRPSCPPVPSPLPQSILGESTSGTKDRGRLGLSCQELFTEVSVTYFGGEPPTVVVLHFSRVFALDHSSVSDNILIIVIIKLAPYEYFLLVDKGTSVLWVFTRRRLPSLGGTVSLAPDCWNCEHLSILCVCFLSATFTQYCFSQMVHKI